MRSVALACTVAVLALLFSQAALAAPQIVSEKAVSLAGKVETRREAAMQWYYLNTGKGKPLLIGPVYMFEGAKGDCLEKAEASGSPVTISGKLTLYDNGSGGFDEAGVQCAAGAAAAPGSAKQLKLNDKLHSQFMENESYALADALLNATWKQVKPNVSEAQYKQILQQQRQWASKGRDEAASRYAASMPEAEAFTKAMQERTAELVGMVAADPVRGSYAAKEAGFTAVVMQDGTIAIEGDAASEQGNVCSFDGKGKAAKGWITMKHDDAPDFYLLFTIKGAQIAYTTSGESQGCGMGVSFNYSYARK